MVGNDGSATGDERTPQMILAVPRRFNTGRPAHCHSGGITVTTVMAVDFGRREPAPFAFNTARLIFSMYYETLTVGLL